MDRFSVRLPGGFWWEGKRYQEAELRVLTGRDEEYLREIGTDIGGAAWTTALLTRCLERLGPLQSPAREAVRSLTVGDREALLLHLRRQAQGRQMSCILSCPACGEKMDLELIVDELILPEYPLDRQVHELTIENQESSFSVRFRLPTGADQEAVAALADRDPVRAAERLMTRCVETVSRGGSSVVPEHEWPTDLQETLSERIEQLDPQAELRFDLTCPACEHEFSSLLDTAAYFSGELERRIGQLFREVHTLALYYHWSEREILDMTARRRRRYIDLLNETLSTGS